MNRIKISIIVPIYNSEKYLKEAIESLIHQTLKEIEIILVNDGSTDNSQKICENYAKLDERIKLINKKNGGLSDARNVGLKNANGKYIMFLDSDDKFEEDSCEYMYNVIEETKSDYVIGNYIIIDNDGKKWEKPAFDQEKYKYFKISNSDFEKSFFVMNSTAWNKIYNTKFLVENNIKFDVPAPEEDDYFTSLCYMNGKGAYYTSKVMYLYRNSILSISKECSLNYFKGINSAYKTIYDTFEKKNYINAYRYKYAKKRAYILGQLIDSNKIDNEQKIEWLKEFEWYFNLENKLKICDIHASLKNVMEQIKNKDYNNAIIEMNKIKEYRSGIPIEKKKRMTFPTIEDYRKMGEYDNEFTNK